MSDDNSNAESFDFDFDLLNADEPLANTGGDSFDLDQPFGDDAAVPSGSLGDSPANTDENSFDLGNSFGGDPAVSDLAVAEGRVSADTSYLSDSVTGKKKKGGGWFSRKKEGKEKPEKSEKKADIKKEKSVKEPKPAGDRVPLDLAAILCIAFSVFLLVSLLVFNVAAFLTAGGSLMQTLCFLGAFNIIGLVLVAVPILFYKFPQERTLPNVLLGLSAGALFTSVLLFVHNFYYYYGFTLSP